ncbi:HipA domain-containing protein [Bradyrhizobium sacchari]|uniref:HipA domain-containing protein n=1 Tax=Bradyrhizobium sacchari TaxID=1399419 RepID=UPI003D310A5E
MLPNARAHDRNLHTDGDETGTAGERSYLLVERYDRRHDGKRWRRLHQEDFCQALGRPPAAKCQNNDRGLKDHHWPTWSA